MEAAGVRIQQKFLVELFLATAMVTTPYLLLDRAIQHPLGYGDLRTSCLMFFGVSGIGVVSALISPFLSKMDKPKPPPVQDERQDRIGKWTVRLVGPFLLLMQMSDLWESSPDSSTAVTRIVLFLALVVSAYIVLSRVFMRSGIDVRKAKL
jgi:hypothetical protein